MRLLGSWRSIARRAVCVPAVLALIGVVMMPGCGGKKAPVEKGGGVPRGAFRMYDSSREIVDSIRIDLDRNGAPEFVVTSRERSGDSAGGARIFDRVEVFSIDPATQRFSSMFVDPVVSGTRIAFRELTKSRRMNVLIDTDAGGNDPVSSRGLNVYGYRSDGHFTILHYSDGGAPELRDLDGDGTIEILQTGEFWGMATRSEAITYTEAVYAFDGFSYVESNVAFTKYYDREIAARKSAYAKAKTRHKTADETAASALHRACAEWLVWIAAKHDLALLRRTWEGEKAYLRAALDQNHYEDLDDFVQTVIEDERTRQEQNRSLS